jgi:hypothetical protein
METVIVREYSLIDFCVKVQELVKQGYEFDFESSTNCPINFGYNYFAGMQKKVKQTRVSKKNEEGESA